MRATTRERVAGAVLLGITLVVVAPLFFVVGTIIVKGAPAISVAFLTEAPRASNRAGGIFPAIVGTLALVALTLAIALPLGVLGAVFLREYAQDRPIVAWVRLAILSLAGVPSVVHGLFGLAVFVTLMGLGASLIAGALTLSMLILPVLITTTEQALRAVPDSIRAASLALGATRWQTTWRAVLPVALPGILTGAILGVSRAAGETAPTLFTVAAFYLPLLPTSVYDQVMVLPYHLYVMATQVPGVRPEVPYGIALVLLLLVLGLNLVAIVLRASFQRQRLG